MTRLWQGVKCLADLRWRNRASRGGGRRGPALPPGGTMAAFLSLFLGAIFNFGFFAPAQAGNVDVQRLLAACFEAVSTRNFAVLDALGKNEAHKDGPFQANVMVKSGTENYLLAGALLELDGRNGTHEVCSTPDFPLLNQGYKAIVSSVKSFANDKGFERIDPDLGFSYSSARCETKSRAILISVGFVSATGNAKIMVLGLNDLSGQECEETI